MKKKVKTFETEKGSYTVKFGMNQLIDIEEELGSFDKLDGEVKFSNVLTIFYHGLKALDKSVTKEQAGDAIDEILDVMEFKDFVEQLIEVMTATFKGTPSEEAK